MTPVAVAVAAAEPRASWLAVGARPLRRPLSTTFGASALIQGMTVVSGVILARSLGPTGRGELTAVLLWPAMLAALGSIGLVEATTFYAAGGTVASGTLVGTALLLGLLQSAVLTAIGGGVVAAVFHGATADVRASAYAYLLFIPLNLLSLYLMAVLNGLERIVAFNALRVLTIAGATGGIVLLALGGYLTVPAAAVVYLLATFVTGLIAALLVVRAVGVSSLSFDGTVARRLSSFGVRSHTSSVSSALNERLDQLLISIFLAPARLGLYVVAVTLTCATSLVGTSVSMIALPALARAQTAKERLALGRRFVGITLIGASAVSIPLLLFTPWVVGLFFGHAFQGATAVARVLLVAGVLLSVNRALGSILKGVGRPLDAGTAEFIALGATVVGLTILLPALGILGAGIASLIAYGVSTGWMLRRASRALNSSVTGLMFTRREIEP